MATQRRVYKYGTGQPVPEGAVFLSTIVQEVSTARDDLTTVSRLVWHYFLVEVPTDAL